ncbi:MAG: hypothetical protein K0U23_06685 [Gammaproteobacteria bacterium]|nr:hypothetical protein [Gammaproteobacteria bacterium]
MPTKYNKEVFLSMMGTEKDLLVGSLVGALHMKKARVGEGDVDIISIDTPENEARARAVLATVTNQSRLYLTAHGIINQVHAVMAYGKEVNAAKIAEFLKASLTHPSLKDPLPEQRLRISLLICLGGLGIEEHTKFITGSGIDVEVNNATFSQAETDNFEASFAVMLCSHLYGDGAGIVCDVVGRRDITHIRSPNTKDVQKYQLAPGAMNKNIQMYATLCRSKGVKFKSCEMKNGVNFQSLKSGSLKFIATISPDGKLVFYDEFRDFFYSYTKNVIIAILLMTKVDPEDIPVISACIDKLKVAAHEILRDQIARGQGEERPSPELTKEGAGHSAATKLARSPDLLTEDYLKITTILGEAVFKASGARTLGVLEHLEKKTKVFAEAVGAREAPERL